MKSFFIKLTSAIVIDGEILTAGTIAEVSEREAKNLLHRGKAVLATIDDGIDHEQEDPMAEKEFDVNKASKQELLKFCKMNDIYATDGMTKDQIIDAIDAASDDGALGD